MHVLLSLMNRQPAVYGIREVYNPSFFGNDEINLLHSLEEKKIRSITLTHSERRPQNIYSYEEINLYCIIKLATSLFHYKSVNLMFCVHKIKYEHLAILSNL